MSIYINFSLCLDFFFHSQHVQELGQFIMHVLGENVLDEL